MTIESGYFVSLHIGKGGLAVSVKVATLVIIESEYFVSLYVGEDVSAASVKVATLGIIESLDIFLSLYMLPCCSLAFSSLLCCILLISCK